MSECCGITVACIFARGHGGAVDTPSDATDAVRRRVLEAAVDEVTAWGIERFSAQNLAARHGIDRATIAEYWVDEEALLLDVLLEWPGPGFELPDTGSLAGDLTWLTMAMVEYVSSDQGRKIQGALAVPNRTGLRTAVRLQVWHQRAAAAEAVFDRAVARNEMRANADRRIVLQMVTASINVRVLLTHEPVDEQYLRSLVDLACRAVAP